MTTALARNAAVRAVMDMLSGGSLEILTGTGELLVSVPFLSPAFDEPAAGRALARLEPQATITATGEAARFIARSQAGAEVLSGSCGPAGCDMTLNASHLIAGGLLETVDLSISISESQE
jgi:hypothetical protein